jgi:hypothetical protein
MDTLNYIIVNNVFCEKLEKYLQIDGISFEKSKCISNVSQLRNELKTVFGDSFIYTIRNINSSYLFEAGLEIGKL